MKNSIDGLTLKPNSLAQMLRQNGGCKVVVAAPQGIKMDLARKLGAGDVGFQKIYIHVLMTVLTTTGIHRTFSFKPRSSIPEDQG
jgi:hypothetical protein